MSARFPTLLLREWLQHQRGWLITLLLPPLIFLALLPFGQVSGFDKASPLGMGLNMTRRSYNEFLDTIQVCGSGVRLGA